MSNHLDSWSEALTRKISLVALLPHWIYQV